MSRISRVSFFFFIFYPSFLNYVPMLTSLARMVFNANATGSIMLHGCLDSETAKGIESDCNLMELEMAANVTLSRAT